MKKVAVIPIVVEPLGAITTKFEKYNEALQLRTELSIFRNQHC